MSCECVPSQMVSYSLWQSVIIYKNISMYFEQQYKIKGFKFYTSCTSWKLIWQTLGGMSKMTYPHWLKHLSDFKQSSRITAIGHIALVAINGTITLEPYHMSWQGWAGTIIHLMTMTTRVPFYEHKSTFIPAWISNYIHHKVWDEITYPFPNFNGATVEVWEWISNFIPHFTGTVITYPRWTP